MSDVKHIIFDLYGTLIDSNPRLLSTKRSELMQWGKKRWMCHNKNEDEYFSDYCEQHGGDPEELKESFHEMEDSTAFFPDILDLVQEIKEAGYGLHVLSNCGRSIQGFVRDHEEVFDVFDTLNFSYELGYTKPQPEAFEKVLERIDAQPEECVMIGDSPRSDVEAAQQLGMQGFVFDGRHMPAKELRERLQKANIL